MPRRRQLVRKPGRTAIGLPKRVVDVIGSQVLRIEYVHEEDGKTYFHEFDSGVQLKAFDDGSLWIVHPRYKLWGDY